MPSVAGLYVPWIPPALVKIWEDAWASPEVNGDPVLALESVRQHELYDVYFPGNRRDDGSLRYDEGTYLATVEGYENAFLSVNINPDLFRDYFATLIEGSVDANEFARRIDGVAERILVQAPAIREQYATYFAEGELTDSAIIAASIDPHLSDAILNKQITMAEIGGEAKLRGFGIDTGLADRLFERGINRSQASDLFSQGVEQMPVLDVLARRHNDPDDDFDLNDFLASAVFDDREQRQRIRRLLDAERASFSQASRFATNQAGGILGLRPI